MSETLVKSFRTTIRLTPQDRDEIDRQAKLRGLNRTDYLVRSALGELDIDPADERFSALELRLSRLERQLGV